MASLQVTAQIYDLVTGKDRQALLEDVLHRKLRDTRIDGKAASRMSPRRAKCVIIIS
jgi:hypothetical protein